MLKSGDKAISTILRRSSKGLELTVILHPAVEEFMKASAGEEVVAVDMYGRKWTSRDKLFVYDVPDSMKGIALISGSACYRLDQPGRELVTVDASTGIKCINMAFTRLQGASTPEGITFSIAGAFEKEDVIWIASAITEAGTIICQKYVYPMVISTSNTVRADVIAPLPQLAVDTIRAGVGDGV